jgi:hypothetical protein
MSEPWTEHCTCGHPEAMWTMHFAQGPCVAIDAEDTAERLNLARRVAALIATPEYRKSLREADEAAKDPAAVVPVEEFLRRMEGEQHA